MKRFVLVLALVAIFPKFLWAINDYYLPKPQKLIQVKARLAGTDLTLMLARTYPEKAKGLMFVETMPEQHGMLFVYPSPQYLTFWMKNTRIPLDLVFFDENLKVLEWIEGMEPDQNQEEEHLPKYSSTQITKYALELNAGMVEKLQLKIGDELEIPLACLYSY